MDENLVVIQKLGYIQGALFMLVNRINSMNFRTSAKQIRTNVLQPVVVHDFCNISVLLILPINIFLHMNFMN